MPATLTPPTAPLRAPMSSDADTLVLPSLLMDSVTVRRTDLFTFPAGLYAYEACRAFALVPAGREGLWWLQSAERADLVFLLADPFPLFPGYEVTVPPTELAHLGAAADATLMVLSIVTLPRDEQSAATANLRAPVVLDVARRVGRQVVLQDERLGVQMPFVLD